MTLLLELLTAFAEALAISQLPLPIGCHVTRLEVYRNPARPGDEALIIQWWEQ